MAAPASITLIPDVISAADGTYTESGVIIPGSPYIYRLGAGLPIPYPSGMQVIPPQGVSNVVTVSGGGYGSWTQVASAPGLGQFTVDTTISPTGGQIGFNSGDATKVVSLTYLANTYVNKTWAEAFVTALRDIRDWRGVASGLAGLDANTHVIQAPASGIRQMQIVPNATAFDYNITTQNATWTTMPGAGTATLVTTTGGQLGVRISGMLYNALGSANWFRLGFAVDGGTVKPLGRVVLPASADGFLLAGEDTSGVLTAGSHSVTVMYQCGGATNGVTVAAQLRASTQPNSDHLTLAVVEYA